LPGRTSADYSELSNIAGELLPDSYRHQIVPRHRNAELGSETIVVGDEVALQVFAASGVEGGGEGLLLLAGYIVAAIGFWIAYARGR